MKDAQIADSFQVRLSWMHWVLAELLLGPAFFPLEPYPLVTLKSSMKYFPIPPHTHTHQYEWMFFWKRMKKLSSIFNMLLLKMR